MKQKNFLQIALAFLLTLIVSYGLKAQNTGDIAFVAFNVDGDDDFAIVALVDILANTTIYFTDDETTGVGTPSSLVGSEGTITWNSGLNIIKAGTVIIFSDLSNSSNPGFGSSIGTISRSGLFNLTDNKDGLIAFSGVNSSTPTTYIAALQIGNDSTTLGPFDEDGITLTNTGLVVGSSIIVYDDSASPDGAIYIGSRNNQTSYSNYYSLLSDDVGNWNNIVNGNGETLLPFSQEAFTINTTNWTGNISTNWNETGNWDNGIPTSDSNVFITDVTNDPIVTGSFNTGNITLQTGASIVINGAIINKGITTINNDATLVTSSGDLNGIVTYKRTLDFKAALAEGWYLVSSPVAGENMTSMRTNNSFLVSPNDNTRIGFATYDDSQATTKWNYFNTSSADALVTGQGYSAKLSAAGNISFTGTINTTDVSVGVVLGGANNYNLIGNPFTSYLNTVDFLNDNTNDLTTKDIWVWNQTTNNYDVRNLLTTIVLAPAQGFFVRANKATNLTIAESYQTSTGDAFQKTSKTEITLNMTDGANNRFAKIYYLDNATTGFDNGYDGETFGGVTNSLEVFTHLVENSEGKKYQVQSLPNSDFENMVVPVGVKAAAGKEITFSLEAMNIPNGINVYLEDKLTNTVTLLSEANATYKVTLNDALDGIGRFYLHTKSSGVLGTETIALNNVSIYSIDASTLRVAGLSEGKASVKIYSILGKQVFENSFNASAVKDLQLPKLASGIYVVQLATEKGTLNKKITLE
ncbi:T9SS type A sorting domain-containing protein [Polaribacter sp.]|uniref:T9SS type A sorting domain-containing protein n=1 Tax=Polaribacter sp. TaxID=1920175 RepID=UPI004048D034